MPWSSRIGWKRLTWQIRDRVNTATPCTMTRASHGEETTQRSAAFASSSEVPRPPRGARDFPARPGEAVPRACAAVRGRAMTQTREPAALRALRRYGAGWTRTISGPTRGQHRIFAASPSARAVPSALR